MPCPGDDGERAFGDVRMFQALGCRFQVLRFTSYVSRSRFHVSRLRTGGTANCYFTPVLLLCLLSLSLSVSACAPEKEVSKALVKISNVKVWRTDDETLKVSMNYDLEMGVRLPLPYKEILVFPLDPQIKIGGTLAPFNLHSGTVGVTLQLPKGAVDWDELNDKDTCCIVSLKGIGEDPKTKTSRYERISNEVRVLPPQLSESASG